MILAVLFSFILSTFALQEGDECCYNNNVTSNCVTLDKCEGAVFNVFTNKPNQICEYDKINPVVCCPSNGNRSCSSEPSADEPDQIHFSNRPAYQWSKSEEACRRYLASQCPDLVDLPFTRLPSIRHFIVGGREASAKDYPFMALIGFGEKSSVRWLCGGTLISERFVLTAAHCDSSTRGPARWVRLGELDYDSTEDNAMPTDFEIVDRFVHPGYQAPSMYNDVALFVLDRNVTFSDYIRPICLWDYLNLTDINLKAAGWGQIDFGYALSSRLREVFLRLVKPEKCASNYGRSDRYNRGIDNATMMCAGAPPHVRADTCTGDSGGPLLTTMNNCPLMAVQIGITSFGIACGEPDLPGVYTRISPYVRWIEDIVWK